MNVENYFLVFCSLLFCSLLRYQITDWITFMRHLVFGFEQAEKQRAELQGELNVINERLESVSTSAQLQVYYH